VATVNSVTGFEILLLQQLFLEQSLFFDDVTSGTVLVATVGESPLQQLFLEQSSAILVSRDVTDSYKVGVLRPLVTSFEASHFSDAAEHFERIDA
jgi:hypothetical protein